MPRGFSSPGKGMGAPKPPELTEDAEGAGGHAAGAGGALHGAVVGGGIGGHHAGEDDVRRCAAAEPDLVLVPGVGQSLLGGAVHRTGQGHGVPFTDVRGGRDPDPGSCDGGRRDGQGNELWAPACYGSVLMALPPGTVLWAPSLQFQARSEGDTSATTNSSPCPAAAQRRVTAAGRAQPRQTCGQMPWELPTATRPLGEGAAAPAPCAHSPQ